MISPRQNEVLAPYTTLQVGGPSLVLVEVDSQTMLSDVWRYAKERYLELHILGGGSNVVIADQGIHGLVAVMRTQGRKFFVHNEKLVVDVAAGEVWDSFVQDVVAEGYAGIECLSGIPGTVGATPLQNVGAYGQEVAQTIKHVEVFDRETGTFETLDAEQCQFTYRDSVFKKHAQRYVILQVRFELNKMCSRPTYAELKKKLGNGQTNVDVIRQAVLELRRSKSMVVDSLDENHRSVGSFFLNPIVSIAQAQHVLRTRRSGEAPLTHCLPDGSIKIPAAWLIEQAGYVKGKRHGAFGISSRHSLALVHHGGGTCDQLIEFASLIQQSVHHKFGLWLKPEPTFLGFASPPLLNATSRA